MTRSRPHLRLSRRSAVLSGLVAALVFLCAGATAVEIDDPAAAVTRPVPQIECHSGSPLLLEVTVPDPDGLLAAVRIESTAAVLTYAVPEGVTSGALQLAVTPFLNPGVYDLTIAVELRGDDGPAKPPAAFTIGFVDYVWGRDNLRFGNNADFRSTIGTFGEILEAWIAERFGEVDTAELVLLVDYMYSLFGDTSGLCYAFSGTELRHWLWPELRPSYYRSTYEMRALTGIQREMNYLQLDMAFERFVGAGRAERATPAGSTGQPVGQMSREEIQAELVRITQRVADGVPTAIGLTGPDLHHSMLVYGYVENPAANTVDLIVANNWKSEEQQNLRSADAEVVRIHLDEDRDRLLEWRHMGGTRTFTVERLFVLDVRREYHHDRADLERLVSARFAELAAAGRGIIVVENAAGAWLSDGTKIEGHKDHSDRKEIEGVTFERLGRTYRFELSADAELEFAVADDAGARVLHLLPVPGEERFVAGIERAAAPETGSTVTRSVAIRQLLAATHEVAEAQ